MKLSDLVKEINEVIKKRGDQEIVKCVGPTPVIYKIRFALVCPIPYAKACTVTLVPGDKHDYSKMEG